MRLIVIRLGIVLYLFILVSDKLFASSKSEMFLSKYAKFLEEGTYQGAALEGVQKLPKSRYVTFLAAFELFEQTKGAVVVELGTSRSFVHGGHPGCNLDDPQWWTPEKPDNWDWGAGFFTLMAASTLTEFSDLLEIHTVDISSAHIARCKIITEGYKSVINYHINTSEKFLAQFPSVKKIDLLYMDTGDMTPIEPTALLHLREAKIVVERNLIAPNGLILIDDVRNGTPRIFGELSEYGKAKYSLPYLLEHGFELLIDEYQVLLRRKS